MGATLVMETKKCSECGRVLPISEFNKNRNSKDGLQDRCRECFSRYNKRRYASNPEKFKKDVKSYKEANPRKVLETRMKTCAKSPTQKNAYRVVDAALKSGDLIRPSFCSACGCSDAEHRIEAHHYDYSKPLDVIWLCTPCHARVDALRRVHDGKRPYSGSGHKWSSR